MYLSCFAPPTFSVNGQTEGSQQKAEDLPFIVVAATENDSTNEPFIIPTDDSKPNQPGFNLLPSGLKTKRKMLVLLYFNTSLSSEVQQFCCKNLFPKYS